MLALEAVPFRECRQRQPENSRDQEENDLFQPRRLIAVGLEMTVMTRLPTLDWPTDLFADARTGVTV